MLQLFNRRLLIKKRMIDINLILYIQSVPVYLFYFREPNTLTELVHPTNLHMQTNIHCDSESVIKTEGTNFRVIFRQ